MLQVLWEVGQLFVDVAGVVGSGTTFCCCRCCGKWDNFLLMLQVLWEVGRLIVDVAGVVVSRTTRCCRCIHELW